MGSDHPHSCRILVADDESVNLKILAAFVRDFGHEVVLAGSGDQALGLFDAGIDLALLDVLMPGMDGFEVVRRIRRDPVLKDIPVIMVTALTGREERLAAVEAGANDFIAKPIDKTELKVRMASLLRMKKSQDELKRYQASLEDMVSQRTEALRMAWRTCRRCSAPWSPPSARPSSAWPPPPNTKTTTPPATSAA